MPPKKGSTDVVEIESSSDDDEQSAAVVVVESAPKTAPPVRPLREGPEVVANPPSKDQGLESRTFWKAGDYIVASPANHTSSHSEDLLEHARVHPKFLHSNATSHKWAFGAIAELLDNAVDEIHKGATFVKVDKVNVMDDNSPALLFQDDGSGMDPDGIRKCMSLGYSSKKTNTTIGQYGNGFKTSTMRLGADVIVFSRAIRDGRATQSIGLLSYTFLRQTGQDDAIVPMIDFDTSSHWAEPIIYGSQEDWSTNLNLILEWSPFKNKEELMQQFEDIRSHGTKVMIYNLWLNDEGIYELGFDDDNEDIRLRDEANQGGLKKLNKKTIELQSHISYRFRYSLRAYASILYLRKFVNFKILLRGKLVEQYNIGVDLKYSEVVKYKPHASVASKEVSVETTIGFIKEAPNLGVSGFNVYHKNRLIRPFWKVIADGTSRGHGVVGVLEANFIEPAHDKQDFERSSLYIRLEAKLKQIVSDYWRSHCHLVGYHPPGYKANKVQNERSGQTPVALDMNVHKQFGRIGQSSVSSAEIQPNQPISGLAANGFYKAVTLSSGPSGETMLLEDICEENIQLFMRCEAHKQKDAELKEKIRKVERELDETRKKCAELASYLEEKKNQHTNQG